MASATTTDHIPPPADPLTEAKVKQWKLDCRALLLTKVKEQLTNASSEDDVMLECPLCLMDDIANSNMCNEHKIDALADAAERGHAFINYLLSWFGKLLEAIDDALRIIN
ncbi:hypothetical protein KC330_g7912 [Hortaea werneckii]|nr:hypothetical protein KC330_g7912 [Hortaea werneckii]